MRDLKGDLKVKVVDFEGKAFFENSIEAYVSANSNEKLQIEGLAECLAKADKTKAYVKLELVENESLLAERFCYLAYSKDLKLPKAEPKLKVTEADGKISIEVTTDAFAKDVQVYCTNAMGDFSDNFFDLEAGESRKVVFTPKEKTPDFDFGIRCLNGL